MISSTKTLVFCVCLSVFPLLLKAQESAATFFDFQADVRVFVAQAAQNVAGEDFEWRKEGMHPLRVRLRSELSQHLDTGIVARLRSFRDKHPSDWQSWASYALLTSGPPDFALSYDPKTSPYAEETARTLSGLSPLLAEFYKRADIPGLWQVYGPELQALNDEFRPYAAQALDDIMQYCRLDKDYFSRRATRIHVVFAPLQSYFRAFTDKVNNEIYLVFGPQPTKPSRSSFYHEALHHVTTPLTERLDTAVTNRFNDLYSLASTDGHLGYNHIDEALVRTIGIVLHAKASHDPDTTVLATITHEYKLGFIFCLPFYEQLKAYEASGMTFEQYFPRMLASIDIEREKERWKEIAAEAR